MDLGAISQQLSGMMGKGDEGQASQGGEAAGGGGLGGVVGAVLGLINGKGGEAGNGLQSMLGQLKSSGLAEKAESWVQPGENANLSPDEVKQALGPDVDAIAQQVGVNRDQAAEQISQALPQVVDKLTPDGQVPELGDLSALLNKVLGK